MTVLVLGGRGKTSSRLSSLLSNSGFPFVQASRSQSEGGPHRQCAFDWLDETTWANPFTAVYMVAPPPPPPHQLTDMFPPMKAFIDFARTTGVRRIVLLSVSMLPRGGPSMGLVHNYLAGLEPEGVEWAVLRPSWFMENFSELQHRGSMAAENMIYSAAQDGKIPFVSAEDIAAVAFRALTDPVPHNTDHVILGPELLTYDDVAQILSTLLGKTIVHEKLSESDLTNRFVIQGTPLGYAKMLSAHDTAISQGAEDRLNTVIADITGREPKRFVDFARENKSAWL
ncbi:NAD(P)-binding protein [Penicillium robsamsonii]|uniref:NAD(P)-binding protein n=1 Tax=Penicillium robsamsonii TaxID=1792511 RepID=UPI0025465F4F|nr:NAD(P)-binding protein [Penicillium robsamsonii]KAJ5836789.1 NAD(P)-binding protein [Penicillium robsamsonii]